MIGPLHVMKINNMRRGGGVRNRSTEKGLGAMLFNELAGIYSSLYLDAIVCNFLRCLVPLIFVSTVLTLLQRSNVF